ncbi:ribonuclease R [Mycoplasma iguanae]|uniref:Ribonuclease R n=1 Tax=Mycoplasma iguanae TaxID=292461 RepID=A0ABY5R917_9MOLU|nr:ribonuclease R [Mycoplasma iguanae]UVD81455.1 ribonuclease R [Mycoplasma iguanae]
MSKNFNQDEVIKYISSKSEKPSSFIDIVKFLKILPQNNRDFSLFLSNLVSQGLLIKTKEGEYIVPKILASVEGILSVNLKGFGFVKSSEDSEKNIFIPKSGINGAFNGDLVKINVIENFKNNEEFNYGIVTKILQRNTKYLVGTIIKNGAFLDFEPINEIYKARYHFVENTKIEENDVVKVEIQKHENNIIFIKLLKILGKYNEAFIDIQAEIEISNLPYEFKAETIAEAYNIPKTIDNDPSIHYRIDLRKKIIYTIDGDDTKDFDDAISVEKLKNGNYLLGVHIADVTHYVKEGSALDLEAAERGTSIYLPNTVIPMLPESLSNGICSLNPQVDRFTLTMESEINSSGENVNVKIYPSIINSYQRLTYKDVNKFFQKELNFDDKLSQSLNLADELAQILRKYKSKEGYIDFEIEESKIILDENGKTIDIKPTQRGKSEILIEDFMVRANEIISKFMTEKGYPFIYRIHDAPEIEKLEQLQAILKMIDVDITIPLSKDPKDFANAIAKVKKIRFDEFIKILLLRTMQKAIYSPQNIGHFGLASKFYSHFTSPIRRYPDLIAHRMIRRFLFEKHDEEIEHFKQILPSIAKLNSESEQRAVELERKVSGIKKAEFYESKIGHTLNGQIMSISKFGIFVEFADKVDALISKFNIFANSYVPSNEGLKVQVDDHIYKMGDVVEVIIIGINKAQARIDAIFSKDLKRFEKHQIEVQKERELRKNNVQKNRIERSSSSKSD